jgi:hypothetical protein
LRSCRYGCWTVHPFGTVTFCPVCFLFSLKLTTDPFWCRFKYLHTF